MHEFKDGSLVLNKIDNEFSAFPFFDVAFDFDGEVLTGEGYGFFENPRTMPGGKAVGIVVVVKSHTSLYIGRLPYIE